MKVIDDDELYGLHCDIGRLEQENTKLRKLVQDFDKCLTEAVRLAYIQGHMTIYDDTLLDSLHPRMRELGMEVEESDVSAGLRVEDAERTQ